LGNSAAGEACSVSLCRLRPTKRRPDQSTNDRILLVLQIAFGFVSSRRNVDLIRPCGCPFAVVVARLIRIEPSLDRVKKFSKFYIGSDGADFVAYLREGLSAFFQFVSHRKFPNQFSPIYRIMF
jgi:hypothetical protein